MSSILKALKKVEDDKNIRRPDELKIDADILRADNFPRFSSSSIIAASLLLMACGAGATYLYMNRHAAPMTPPTGTTASVSPPAPPPALTDVRKNIAPERPAGRQALSPAKKTSATVKSAKPVTKKSPDRAISKTIPPTSPPAPAKSIPALRVNGIAFDSNAADSMAIINGVAVTKGAVIEGATVAEVMKDRVLFHYGGEPFEILLGQSNR